MEEWDGELGAAMSPGALPVLVDFSASWCPPCRMLEPVLDQLALDFQDRLQVVRVDVDRRPDLAERYSVMANPSLILFSGGRPLASWVGYRPRADLQARLEALLA